MLGTCKRPMIYRPSHCSACPSDHIEHTPLWLRDFSKTTWTCALAVGIPLGGAHLRHSAWPSYANWYENKEGKKPIKHVIINNCTQLRNAAHFELDHFNNGIQMKYYNVPITNIRPVSIHQSKGLWMRTFVHGIWTRLASSCQWTLTCDMFALISSNVLVFHCRMKQTMLCFFHVDVQISADDSDGDGDIRLLGIYTMCVQPGT